MKKFFKSILFNLQKSLVEFFLFFSIKPVKKNDKMLVGEETASILYQLSSVINADSINLQDNRFYKYNYTYKTGKMPMIFDIIYRSYLLSRVVTTYHSVTYIGSHGLLLHSNDGRDWEFDFLRKRNVKIVCVFTGTDIRSYKKMKELPALQGMDTVATYHPYVLNIDFDAREQHLKKLSLASDRYADLIFNYPVEQVSYMKSNVCYFPYMIPDELFSELPSKWSDDSKLVVLHSPSSPIPKGTQLVRAAVKKLQQNGYKFEYVELNGVSHEKVIEELKRAHIVLNEFYAFVPGVFGLEAMAANSVLLTSADRNIEPMLPEGANEAWIVTPYWDVYGRLKLALDTPFDELMNQASIGHKWALKHGSFNNAKAYFSEKYQSL
ncbi:hypothetical protein [Vibrio scophthalmi]|uniref:Glycosyl transferase family 1 domain-containing protein n=1 Tax=Vibrio scophthalmi TaxID=45658 RepID=A0A1E3WJJ3_9VIBR|nr:hypothetical protein [Vibrio scophthalmi]ODS09946.1 hypothetical protein VSF3289_00184 [Vibrio scophthalmi]